MNWRHADTTGMPTLSGMKHASIMYETDVVSPTPCRCWCDGISVSDKVRQARTPKKRRRKKATSGIPHREPDHRVLRAVRYAPCATVCPFPIYHLALAARVAHRAGSGRCVEGRRARRVLLMFHRRMGACVAPTRKDMDG